MPTNHTGDATGLADADPIIVSNPNDGEALTAASNSSAPSKLADFLTLAKTLFGRLATLNTWALKQTFSVDPGFAARSVTNLGSLGANWSLGTAGQEARSYLNPLGDVCLEGIIKASGVANGNLVGVLPAGRRPAVDRGFIVPGSVGSILTSIQVGVDTSGNVTAWDTLNSTNTFALNDNFSLDGVSFRPAP